MFHPNNEAVKMLKCALWINFLALIMLFMSVPTMILAIIYSGCDEVAGECDGFIVVMRFLLPVKVILVFLHLFLSLKRIMANKNPL